MFDKLKQMHQLKKMQDEFKKEELTIEKKGVTVTMNGAFEIQEIKLNSELNIEEQQDALKEALNEARETIQRKLAQKMMAGGMGF